VLGNPTYIDCDFGEAYKVENNEYISLNNHIDLGSDLPKLAKGNNIISVDSSITELKLVPRWWKI
jgi:phage-related protein